MGGAPVKNPLWLNLVAIAGGILGCSVLGGGVFLMSAGLQEVGAAQPEKVSANDRAQMQAEMRASMDLLEAAANGESPEAVAAKAAATAPVGAPAGGAGGDAQALSKLMRDIVTSSLAAQQEYQKAIEDIGIARLLDAKRVDEDTSLRESRAMVRKAREAVQRMREKIPEMQARARETIEKSSLSDPAKRQALRGFDASRKQNDAVAQESVDLEAQMIDGLSEAVEFLGSHRGSWSAVNGQFEFTDQGALDEYEAILQRVDELGKKQQALAAQLMQRQRERIDQMGR
ncbi:MAG: hypothetical protein U0625_00225 [Phycisphaerales bacterium]